MKLFFDANIFLDTLDRDRQAHIFSKKVYEKCLLKNYQIYTSCDLITTIYYINSKYDKKNALHNIEAITSTVTVIPFSNLEILEAVSLMKKDTDYKDLEDTLQYILAKKEGCDLIISNDQNFISKDIPLLATKEFLERLK